MNSDKILIIGYGAMAAAIAQGLNGKYHMEICGRDPSKARDFIARLGLQNAVALEVSAKSVAESPILDIQDKILLLCIKPYGLGSFCYKGRAKSVYSVLAGVSIAKLAAHIQATSYVRLMPNIAALHGCSATTAFCSPVRLDLERQTPKSQALESPALESRFSLEALRAQAEMICRGFGEIVFVQDEKLIDSSIATSGSAPAFLALVAQALVDSGVMVGLSRADSSALVAQTFAGMGELLKHHSPQELIDKVTTPGGTTIEGLAVLESRGVRGAFMQAARASVEKARTASLSCQSSTQPSAPAHLSADPSVQSAHTSACTQPRDSATHEPTPCDRKP